MDQAEKIIRYKARWVVKGYEKRKGINHTETFDSVVMHMSCKAVLAIAAAGANGRQDSFFYRDIKDGIFSRKPAGQTDGPTRACRLDRALYGLEQAPRVW